MNDNPTFVVSRAPMAEAIRDYLLAKGLPLRDIELWTGDLMAIAHDHDHVSPALQACWDEYHELMPDALYDRVKKTLGIREFTAAPPVRGPACTCGNVETAGRGFENCPVHDPPADVATGEAPAT